MTKTKKYLLTNIIVEKCKTLASVEITLKDELILSNFIEKRLQLHGRNGYMFHDDGWSIPVNDDLSIQRVGFSVLASNHILNIFNRWLSEIKTFIKSYWQIKIYMLLYKYSKK